MKLARAVADISWRTKLVLVQGMQALKAGSPLSGNPPTSVVGVRTLSMHRHGYGSSASEGASFYRICGFLIVFFLGGGLSKQREEKLSRKNRVC